MVVRFAKGMTVAGALFGLLLSGVAQAAGTRSAGMLPGQGDLKRGTAPVSGASNMVQMEPADEDDDDKGVLLWIFGGLGVALAIVAAAGSGGSDSDGGSGTDSPG